MGTTSVIALFYKITILQSSKTSYTITKIVINSQPFNRIHIFYAVNGLPLAVFGLIYQIFSKIVHSSDRNALKGRLDRLEIR